MIPWPPIVALPSSSWSHSCLQQGCDSPTLHLPAVQNLIWSNTGILQAEGTSPEKKQKWGAWLVRHFGCSSGLWLQHWDPGCLYRHQTHPGLTAHASSLCCSEPEYPSFLPMELLAVLANSATFWGLATFPLSTPWYCTIYTLLECAPPLSSSAARSGLGQTYAFFYELQVSKITSLPHPRS